MCDAVYYLLGEQETRYPFANPAATLPIRRKGETFLASWGRRQTQKGKLPLGGSVRVETLHAGRWDRYDPKSVLLPLKAFALRDIEGQLRWHEVTAGQWLQGALVKVDSEQWVYIVTIDPEMPDTPYSVWPKLVNRP